MNRSQFRNFDKRLRGMGAHPSTEYYRVGLIMFGIQSLAAGEGMPEKVLEIASDDEIENTTRRLLPIQSVLKKNHTFWANTPEGIANFKACLKVALGEIKALVKTVDDELVVEYVGIDPNEESTPSDEA
jgi:hypothetical protein